MPRSALVLYGLFISTVVPERGSGGSSVHQQHLPHRFYQAPDSSGCRIFTKYVNYPWVVLQQAAQGLDYQWSPEVWRLFGLCGAYCVLMFASGLTIFVREDLND